MFSDALDREAAFLSITTDTLPVLLASSGGPFQVIQARMPRTPRTFRPSLFVLRQPGSSFKVDRFANVRTMATTAFLLRLWWPLTSGTGHTEDDQLAFEQAIDSVITRVSGFLGDKTHASTAGYFLQVAERGITVDYDDPEQAIAEGRYTARITYTADDVELIN